MLIYILNPIWKGMEHDHTICTYPGTERRTSQRSASDDDSPGLHEDPTLSHLVHELNTYGVLPNIRPPPPQLVNIELRKGLTAYLKKSDSLLEEILRYTAEKEDGIPISINGTLAYLCEFRCFVNCLSRNLRKGTYQGAESEEEIASMQTIIDHFEDIAHDMNNTLSLAITLETDRKETFKKNIPFFEHGLRILRGAEGWDTGFEVTTFRLLEDVVLPAIRIVEVKHQLPIPIDIYGQEAVVQGIDHQIYQAAYTLMKNARYHASTRKDNIIRIGIKLDDRLIERKPAIGITVMDDGQGFPEAYNGIKRGYSLGSGSGLGLALSQKIAQRHGGHITIHNNGDGGGDYKGACVELVIPKEQETKTMSPLLKYPLP